MAITFDDIREHIPDSTAKDDKALERALSILPVRIVLLLEAEEMAMTVRRFEARTKEAARGSGDRS